MHLFEGKGETSFVFITSLYSVIRNRLSGKLECSLITSSKNESHLTLMSSLREKTKNERYLECFDSNETNNYFESF